MKRYSITVNGTTYDVQVQEVPVGASAPAAAPATAAAGVAAAPAAVPTEAAPTATPTPVPSAGSVKIESPMPGNILDIKVSAGQSVSRGDVLLVLEAMKMENDIVAPSDGTVAGIHVARGDTVDTGALLVSLS